MTDKKPNKKNEKVQKRINLDVEVYEKLLAVSGAKGIKSADYINDLLKEKFKNISNKSTLEQLKKI